MSININIKICHHQILKLEITPTHSKPFEKVHINEFQVRHQDSVSFYYLLKFVAHHGILKQIISNNAL